MNRRVAAVTGSRAEYGLFRPVFAAIQTIGLDLEIICTGQHLLPEQGLTYRDLERDGFAISRQIPMFVADEPERLAPARAVGRAIGPIADSIQELDCDWVLVLGDRVEAFAGATAASLSQTPLAHIHGGDVSEGGLDESLRHAITKLAHRHFVATETSRLRVLQLGEDSGRVSVVGAPGLDSILSEPLPSRAELEDHFGFGLEQAPIVIAQHPVSTQPEQAGAQIRATLEAASGWEPCVICLGPNSDPGYRSAESVITRHAQSTPRFHFVPHLPHRFYLALLREAAVLVGNTSSGLIEAPSFALPFVEVGTRQKGRERGDNVISVDYDPGDIRRAIAEALDPNYRRSIANSPNPYGDGRASERIARQLRDTPLGYELIQKRFVDRSHPS